jgi:uncharacterized coiled-coil protein SlyX
MPRGYGGRLAAAGVAGAADVSDAPRRWSGLLVAFVFVVALPVLADDTVPWDEADKHVGEEVTVEGRVVDVHCSPLSCLLAFEPSFNRFTAVVQAERFDALPPDQLEQRFRGKNVRVHGTIVEREGKPEIILDGPGAIALGGRRREERAREATVRAQTEAAQTEVLERLADVLARIEELTERMADVQERMDGLLARMEDREAALANAAPAPAPPQPEPSYGEPQPRPGFEALRTLKRGMTRAEVERLVGEPQYVESGSHGWVTWYYGYGRSVSFNTRGRVEALVGFPPP